MVRRSDVVNRRSVVGQGAVERFLGFRDRCGQGRDGRRQVGLLRVVAGELDGARQAGELEQILAQLDDIAELPGSDGRAVTESRLTLAHVFSEMEKLPRDQQVLLALVCVDGLSYKEAAETLKLPIGTVMSRLSRARQAIASALMETTEAIPAAGGGARLGRSS